MKYYTKNNLILLLIIFFLSCNKQPLEENIEPILNDNIEPLVENVFNYDLVLTDQIEVDLVAKEKYTKINGNVIISNNQSNTNPITNLDSLYTIKKISKSLKINNTNIGVLKGLENLEEVKDIEIGENIYLNTIDGLGEFSEIENIIIKDNSLRLIKIPHLKKAKQIKIDQHYFSNSNLNYIDIKVNGLEELESLFFNVNNFDLQFNSLEKVSESISLYGNFFDLKGLPKLNESKQLTIANNEKLISLKGLDEINILNALTLRNNNKMESIDGIENLTSLKLIKFIDLVSLENISILKNQNSITSVTIDNTNLKNFNALSNHFGNFEYLHLYNNVNLNSLNGLENIKNINSIIIENNSNLKDLIGLKSINKIGSFQINDNEKLENFNGLENINEIETLHINNTPIKSISELEEVICAYIYIKRTALESISFNNVENLNNLEIESNAKLQKLELKKLTTIENLIIHGNDLLANLDGFEKLEIVKYFLRLTYNPELSDFCSLLNLFSNTINYSYHIEFNSCYSKLTPNDIIEKCKRC